MIFRVYRDFLPALCFFTAFFTCSWANVNIFFCLFQNGARTYCPGCELDGQQRPPSTQAVEVANQPQAGVVQGHEGGDAEMLDTPVHTTGFVHTPVGDESRSRQASPVHSPQFKKLRLDGMGVLLFWLALCVPNNAPQALSSDV